MVTDEEYGITKVDLDIHIDSIDFDKDLYSYIYNVVTYAKSTIRDSDDVIKTYSAFVKAIAVGRNDLRNIIISDLECIEANQLDRLNNDVSLYGETWNAFQRNLKDVGCDYWAKFYEDLFHNRFHFDKKELERRLNVPDEIKKNGACAVARYLKSNSYDDLMLTIYDTMRDLDSEENFEKAFSLLPELELADTKRYEKLIEELEFVFDPSNSIESNKAYWQRHKNFLKYQIELWCLLSNENHYMQKANDKIAQDIPNSDLKEEVNQNDIEQTTTIEEGRAKNSQSLSSSITGALLEVNVLKLIQKLFDNISDAELIELRRQLSGTQGGFDIHFKYKDALGAECNCKIECKDYNNTPITIGTVNEKLTQLALKCNGDKTVIHHWILISPTGKVSNELYDALKVWGENNHWQPIQKVQIWTGVKDETTQCQEPMVNELFSLIPEVYHHYYPNGTLAPELWDEAKRSAVQKKWKEKLAPAILLSDAWRSYLRDPSKLLTSRENDNRTIREYAGLYNLRIPVPCLDEAGNPINPSTAEEYIINWLNTTKESSTLFLLGEYGDGKTFLTYSLARKLSEEFLKSPSNGIIPLRLNLKDLAKGVDNTAFLQNRLSTFGATIGEWTNIKNKHKVLVILDGFDEMSIGMASYSLNANVRRLNDCIKDHFKHLDLLITSRTPVFKEKKSHLLDRTGKEKTDIISLASIDDTEKIKDHLRQYAEENNVLENFEILCNTYNLLGLAAKPLYIDFLKAQMLTGNIEKMGENTDKDKAKRKKLKSAVIYSN